MHLRSLIRVALCSAVLSLFAAHAAAQATQAPAKPFEPQVGQAGKDVVWVPTPQELVDKMLDMAKLTPQDYLIDLGSGDGRTVITAAKRGSRAHGIEYRLAEDLDFVAEVGIGLSDDSANYISGGLAYYLR